MNVYAYPYDTAEGFPFKATAWYWQTGDQWMAVVADWEPVSEWFTDSDEFARPDVLVYTIAELPPCGTLIYRDKNGNEHKVPVETVRAFFDEPDAVEVQMSIRINKSASNSGEYFVYTDDSLMGVYKHLHKVADVLAHEVARRVHEMEEDDEDDDE